jgi:hypothetical protein
MDGTAPAIVSVRTRGIQVHGKKLGWCSGTIEEEEESAEEDDRGGGDGALPGGELVSILISKGIAGTPSDLRELRRTPSGSTATAWPGQPTRYFIARFACGEREESRNSKGAIVLHATAFLSIEAAAPLPGEEDLLLLDELTSSGGTAAAAGAGDVDNDEVESGPSSSHHREDKIERHAVFADWIIATFGRPKLVVDVAAGKGHLAQQLRMRGVERCVCVDPEARPDGPTVDPGVEWLSEPWSEALAESLLPASTATATTTSGSGSGAGTERRREAPLSALFVGLHPDQATEGIVDAALERGLPFAVVPCCVFPSLFPDRRMHTTHMGQGAGTIGVTSYRGFLAYLRAKDPRARLARLPLEGKNIVVYLDPDAVAAADPDVSATGVGDAAAEPLGASNTGESLLCGACKPDSVCACGVGASCEREILR